MKDVLELAHIVAWLVILGLAAGSILGADGILEALAAFAGAIVAAFVWYLVGRSLGLGVDRPDTA